MENKEPLKEYRAKRRFQITPEPRGETAYNSPKPIFVVQKHRASTLHYDFRLEVNGVLKSWAVPKGPSLDPEVKRLAMPTEDHPLDYSGFEGNIPEGEYGAGTVEVWDTGTYSALKNKSGGEVALEQAIENGHASFWLDGKKLRGGFAMTRTGKDSKSRWLLVKMNDTEADPTRDPVVDEPDSALSGRSLEEIRGHA
jgi:DNA ligase D-like protein (predicted 3'-phosphoesterase)